MQPMTSFIIKVKNSKIEPGSKFKKQNRNNNCNNKKHLHQKIINNKYSLKIMKINLNKIINKPKMYILNFLFI